MARSTETIDAFGWKVVRCVLEDGQSYTLFTRSSRVYTAYYVEGACTVQHLVGRVVTSRQAGHLCTDHPPLPQGRNIFTAVGRLVWYCVPLAENAGRQPVVSKLHVPAGTAVPLPADQRILICSGTGTLGTGRFTAPRAVRLTSPMDLTATSDVHVLLFDSQF
jgi:hypothetical protein